MKKRRFFLWTLYIPLIISFLLTPVISTAQTADSGPLPVEQLDQMLAPIALYPDSLLSQILMASTYPLEIVQADRWVKARPGFSAEDLDVALEPLGWDPSVKSLCYFPQVLSMMDENIDWTTKLGDAFLGQEEDVMNSIQRLRARARAAGSLKTTDQQRVVESGGVVDVEPSNPDVVYVPVYDPNIVYGQWWYPGYPPFVIYPFGYVLTNFVSFTFGFFAGFCLFGGFDWGHRRIVVNNTTFITNQTRFHGIRNYNPGERRWEWSHDPFHRRGVVYENRAVRDRFSRDRFAPELPGREPFRPGTVERRGGGIRPPPAAPGSPQNRSRLSGGRPPVGSLPGRTSGEGVRPPAGPGRGEGRATVPAAPPSEQRGRELTRPSPEVLRRELGRTAPPAASTEPSRPYRGFDTGAVGPRPGSGAARATPEVRPSPFTGFGNGGAERSAGQRGQESRSSAPFMGTVRPPDAAPMAPQIRPVPAPQPQQTAPSTRQFGRPDAPQGGRAPEPSGGGASRQQGGGERQRR
jgi:hypothetical protein